MKYELTDVISLDEYRKMCQTCKFAWLSPSSFPCKSCGSDGKVLNHQPGNVFDQQYIKGMLLDN